MPSDLVWTAAIAASGGIGGAVVGGLLSYLGARHAEDRATQREREAREAMVELEDARARRAFERETIRAAHDALLELWGASTHALSLKRKMLEEGQSGDVTAALGPELLERVATARVAVAAWIERIDDEELRSTVWRAIRWLNDAADVGSRTDVAAVDASMGTTMNDASAALGRRLRSLY